MTLFETVRQLLEKDRSYRRFIQNEKIERSTLETLVELTRYCASGRNLQPLKYRIVSSDEECRKVFPLLSWAGYLKDWDGPEEGEKPSAYLVQCLDTDLTSNLLCDDGLQIQAITLGAIAKGIGACIIKSFNLGKLKETLDLPDSFQPLYVIALGKPIEKVVIEPLTGNDIKYYRTPDQVHHVPKRSLEQLLIN